jgi:WD40 repeat protein
VSEDKRWIVTADTGPDSLMVIWDSLTGTPVKTIFNPHENGVTAVDMSPDALFIATLSSVPNNGKATPPSEVGGDGSGGDPESSMRLRFEDDGGDDGPAAVQYISLWDWTVERENADGEGGDEGSGAGPTAL